MLRTRIRTTAVLAAVAALAPITAAGAASDPAQLGAFGAPFEEAGEQCVIDADGRELCKPAGATVAALATGRVLYWDALEGTENVDLNAVMEGAHQTRNDRTRVLDLSGPVPRFSIPTPEDGGANPDGNGGEHLPGVPTDDPVVNDGDLFCSDQVQLADGRIIAVGGTDYYAEPYAGEVNGTDYGVIELEGLKAARIFDPYTQTWTQSGSMHHGRWYPSLVTLPGGRLLVAGGVTKLIKPMYADHPADSGSNVKQLETYDPGTGEWTLAPPTANRSLPLYPRLHLLPNGHVYYDAAGQVFNPAGQSYDEAFWNIAASFDPSTERWTDLGVPGVGLGALPGAPDVPGVANGDLAGVPVADGVPTDGLPTAGGDPTGVPGFRGSTFSIMLPLRPDESGRYRTVELLSAGGIAGVTPGTYVAQSSSQVNTVTIGDDGTEALSSRATGPLNAPRWYGTGVLLPSGEVMTFSGADRDEVVAPGSGVPVTTPELWDPETETWRQVAPQGRARTYHSTAMLLPDGRVLVGGHAPIPTGYGFNVTLPGLSPNEGRDPSFEVYSPPYLFRGDRPTITGGPARIDTGSTFHLALAGEGEAAAVADGGSVVLVRNTAITHLVDSDQRAVVLPVVGRQGRTITVQAPPDQAVAPAGPYLLFANRSTDDGQVPSVGRQVFVDVDPPAALGGELPAGADGQATAPFVPTPPDQVLTENLADALDGGGSGALSALAGGAATAAHLAAATEQDVAPVPTWLVALAIALPVAVLVATPQVARGRPRQRRPRAG
jgi:hypothetical protein